MNIVLESLLMKAIERLKETEFQKFTDVVLLKKFKTEFNPVKKKKDKGCDGIISNRKCVAVYAPENYTLAKFKKKTSDDYDGYEKNMMAMKRIGRRLFPNGISFLTANSLQKRFSI